MTYRPHPLTVLTSAALLASCSLSASDMSCGSCATLISQVQGAGSSSPLIPDGADQSSEIVVEAIVTANASERLSGFFLQEERIDEDGDESTSEGLFVYGAHPELKPGDRVRAKGVINEYYGQTQMVLSELSICGHDALDEVRPAVLKKGVVLQELERYEGMLVHFSGPSALTVTRNYSFNYSSYRNNMDLCLGEPLFKPTQVFPPLTLQSRQLAEQNNLNRITLITDEASQVNGQISYYPSFGPYIHYIRVGDVISHLSGVVGYRYGRYELMPTENISAHAFNHSFSPRKAFPDQHPADEVRIAVFNVLNYFNTLMPDHKENPTGDNRGALTLEEFQLQRDKIVEAITRMDADIVGIIEVENNGFGYGSAIQDLLDTINSRLPTVEHYQAICPYDGTTIGTDAITVGLIYRPAHVSPVGSLHIITMPSQSFTLTSTDDESVPMIRSMRPSLLQTFRDAVTGETVSVGVSHFKSKGSMCYEDYMEYADADGKVPLSGSSIISGSKPTAADYEDDLQGSCNELRVSAGWYLAEQVEKLKYALSDNVLLLGDYNAYGQEDPVRLLTGRTKGMKHPVSTSAFTEVNCKTVPQMTLDRGYGYSNLVVKADGKKTYSYSYDGELGSLDHVLANKSLSQKVTAVQDWHTNSVENTLFEYPKKYSGDLPKDSGPFSSSDHDSLLIDLDFRL